MMYTIDHVLGLTPKRGVGGSISSADSVGAPALQGVPLAHRALSWTARKRSGIDRRADRSASFLSIKEKKAESY